MKQFLVLFFSCIFTVAALVSGSLDPLEVSALLTLRQAITTSKNISFFSDWTREKSESVCSEWRGVTCDSTGSHVVELHLQDLNLEGSLPSVLGNLTRLQVLSLFNNKLHGNVPLSLFRCHDLRVLSLGYNSFEGVFPPLNLTKLEFIDLSANKFIEHVPDTLESNAKLKVLSLGSNKFVGTIPSWIWSLKDLQVLDLSGNNLEGQLPPSVEELRGFFYNSSVPDNRIEFNQTMVLNTKGTTLRYDMIIQAFMFFDLSNNMLDGQIPVFLGSLTGLRFLNMSHNQFSGEIPAELDGLLKLEQLDLSVNELTGGIPDALVSLVRLSSFNVSFNNLSGPVPMKGQFASFQASSYTSSGLCSSDGLFSLLPCESAALPRDAGQEKKPSWWLVSYAFGFVVGLSGVMWTVVLWDTAWDFTFPSNAL